MMFEQVLCGGGYDFMGFNQATIHRFSLMQKLYQSFVFSYMCGIAKLEVKSPGSVAKSKQMGNVWKCCSEVTSGLHHVDLADNLPPIACQQ
jgi:hypothetical protein